MPEHNWREIRPRVRKPLKCTKQLTVWIACNEICEVVTHYTGRRTLPCGQWFGEDTCELCAAELPRFKEFWVAVCDYRPRERSVLFKLTPGAVETSPSLLRHNGDLYGRLLYCERTKGHERSPMIARLIETQDIVTLPPVADVLKMLRRMWNAPDKSKGGDNA